MTAKPQPMAGQSDASDDLIAELAKLMAQDAQGERPAQPSRPVVPVRIPGGDAPVAPAPRFSFERSTAAANSEAPSPSTATVSQPEPRPAPVPEAPEPFHFDFDLNAAEPASAEAAPTNAVAAPASSVEVQPDVSVASADHDSIADLIAAELSVDQPVAETPPAPSPAPVVAATMRPAAPPVSAPTVSAGPSESALRPGLRSPGLQPATGGEQDRFKVAPVFGLASQPASTLDRSVSFGPTSPLPASSQAGSDFAWRQPTPSVSEDPAPVSDDEGVGRDPIDEIESLIGSAMRVELDRSTRPAVAEERPAPSPALRSLATPTIPAPSDSVERPSRALSGADEAILAAAQATGVQIGWVEAPEVSETETTAAPHQRAPRALGMTRAFAGPLVAVTLLLAAGFGLYWVLGLSGESGPAPLLTADASPVKETPVVQPGATATPQSVVFNEIDGVVPGAEEQLVSRDQADVNEVTQVPPVADLSEEGLANRKVRTVTVRPDGTIVSGDDAVAGSTILPVDRPNVPSVPGAASASPELLASVESAATATPPAAPEATVTPEPAVAVSPATPGATVPAVDVAGNPLAGKTAVIPMIRPSGLAGPGISATAPTSPVNAVVNTPASGGNVLPPPPANSTIGGLAAPAAASTAPAQPTALPQAIEVDALPNNAPAYVQLASQRSEADARASAQAMVTRFGPLFGGANLEVQRVDLGERGIYYRVRVPANSRQDANTICTNVKAAGGDCFTM